jgi:anti-anti-sigma regulatory factor
VLRKFPNLDFINDVIHSVAELMMTKVKNTFFDANGEPVGEIVAKIDFETDEKSVLLILSGNILSKSAEDFRDFIQNISCFPGNQWKLDLQHLSTLSLKGMKALIKLAGILRKRGLELKIIAANSVILAMMADLNYLDYFSLSLNPPQRAISSRHILEVNPGEPVG